MISAIGTCIMWIVAFFVAMFVLRLSVLILCLIIESIAENSALWLYGGGGLAFVLYMMLT